MNPNILISDDIPVNKEKARKRCLNFVVMRFEKLVNPIFVIVVLVR